MVVQTSVNLVGTAQVRAMLASLPAEIQRELRPRIKAAGELVAAEARRNVQAWPNGGSKRIPAAIKVRTSFGAKSAGAVVAVDSSAAPHARAYEGVGTRGDTFRRMVYGKYWVNQLKRPFLFPAGRAMEGEAARLVKDGLDAAVAKANR